MWNHKGKSMHGQSLCQIHRRSIDQSAEIDRMLIVVTGQCGTGMGSGHGAVTPGTLSIRVRENHS